MRIGAHVGIVGGYAAAVQEVAAMGRIVSAEPAVDQNLIQQARDYFNRALEAQRRGDWALYGEEIRRLGEILKQ